MSKKNWTEEDVLKIMAVMRNIDTISFSTPVNSDPEQSNTELGDFILDPEPGPQEIAENKDLNRLLNELVTHLGPREQQIITLRYGLKDGKYKTLDEVGAIYNITRERVRQVEMKALKRLRWLIHCKYKIERSDL